MYKLRDIFKLDTQQTYYKVRWWAHNYPRNDGAPMLKGELYTPQEVALYKLPMKYLEKRELTPCEVWELNIFGNKARYEVAEL